MRSGEAGKGARQVFLAGLHCNPLQPNGRAAGLLHRGLVLLLQVLVERDVLVDRQRLAPGVARYQL